MKRRLLRLPRRALRNPRRAPPPPYQPAWNGVFERWTRKWVAHNFWRVHHVIDSREDAVQECAVVFAKCCRRYGDRVNNPAWFMALYIRAVINTWHTLARRDEKERTVVIHTDSYDMEEYEVANMSSTMSTKMLELSQEAKLVLETLMNAPAEVVDYIAAGRHRRHDIVNRRMLYLLGFKTSQLNAIDEVTDLVDE